MIYTVTFNPSLDYVVRVPDFCLGKTNRTHREALYPGGKGVNVAIVLTRLGVSATALGFRAGFTGAEIERQLEKLGVRTDFIPIPGNARINVKLQNLEGTEINGMGPAVPPEQVAALMERLDALKSGDTLVLAGSIPGSMPPDSYQKILERQRDRGVRIVVDAAGALLRSVLPYRPFLVKPNHQELGQLFGVTLETREAVIPYARKLQALGARNVLVSLASRGAVMVCEDGLAYQAEAPKGTLVNGVGAGDSMVAGFLSGWLESGSYERAFSMAVAGGSASAFSEHLAGREEILRLREHIRLQQV